MIDEDGIRRLMAPGDPARGVTLPGPARPAHSLIALAEQTGTDPARTRSVPGVRRRLVLAAAFAATVATAAAVSLQGLDLDSAPQSRPAPRAVVITPIAYEVTAGAPDAAANLRRLADTLIDSPFDRSSGPYTFFHLKEVGVFGAGAEDGRYHKAAATDLKWWAAADTSGRQVSTPLPAEYPDEASRRHFAAEIDIFDNHQPTDQLVRAGNGAFEPPQSLTRAVLSRLLHTDRPDVLGDAVMRVYMSQGIPRSARADILRILADQHQFDWRGAVTDRLGRDGVAITRRLEGASTEELIVFDERTGELLSHEHVSLNGRPEVTSYRLLYETRRTSDMN